MENRNSTGYAFRTDIEDTRLDEKGVVLYDFRVFESQEQARQFDSQKELVHLRVVIEEVPA